MADYSGAYIGDPVKSANELRLENEVAELRRDLNALKRKSEGYKKFEVTTQRVEVYLVDARSEEEALRDFWSLEKQLTSKQSDIVIDAVEWDE